MAHCDFQIIYEHLVIKGMDPTYNFWYHHGEVCEGDEMENEVDDSFMCEATNFYESTYMGKEDIIHDNSTSRKENKFSQKVEEANTPLYGGCTKYTKMSAVVALYKLKTFNGWSDTSFTSLLGLLHDMLPMDNVISRSIYEKVVLIVQVQDGRSMNEQTKSNKVCPPSTDGKIRHPVDSVAWETIDKKWPEFSMDPRNLSIWKSCRMHYKRRFLSRAHPYRRKKAWFDGRIEEELPPKIATGSAIYAQLQNFNNCWGKREKKKSKSHKDLSNQRWKKRSIFFDLPYWKELPIRHNLDVMHVEKNVCESIIGTLLDINGKSKDGVNARKDLQLLKIRPDLYPQDCGGRTYLPPAPHTLSKSEKKIFCSRLYKLKLPDGYSSNISKCVSLDECKVMGLKSHDYHVLMQQLLPVVLRGLLPKGPRHAIYRLCSYFNRLCQRIIDREVMLDLEKEVVDILCLLERYFPPSFFDIMTHLVIHLGREACICGPVQFRWMYPFERYMKVLKGYVRNKARPEGCIASCYLADECVDFSNKYFKQSVEVVNSQQRNEEYQNDVILEGRPISSGTSIELFDDVLENAHRYVLFNTSEVEPFIEIHMNELMVLDKRLEKDSNLLWKIHTEQFPLWLKSKIELDSSVEGYSELLKWLANGPRKNAMSYTGYIINGKRFHTKSVEKSTQNNGVAVDATTLCRSSAKDKSQVMDVVAYYGVLQEIILLDYYVYQLPIFKCDWANVRNGVKVEEGFTLVNLHQSQSKFVREPFILASQAKQVFYARENDTSNWYVVLKAPPRGFHDLEMYDENYDDTLVSNENISNAVEDVDESDELTYARQDCEDTMSLKVKGKKRSTRRKLIGDSLLLPNEENMESSPIDVHPNTLSPKPTDKIVEGNPILDSPAARTRLAIRRQATTLANEKAVEDHVEDHIEEPQLETTTLPNEKAVEDHVVDEEPPFETMTLRKKTRGPTKMKTIAVEKQSRVDIVFNEYGQPIGNESVGLASFLGPLVREVVPVNLENWLKLPTRLKVVLWKSIQSRYNVEDWQKKFFFQKMGRLWRAGKSRLVKQIRDAPTKDAILKLMPDNLQSVDDWMDFVSEKTSATFKLKSEKYKAMKKKQLPHTCSRKGYARLAEEMRKSSSDPSLVTRVALWTKAHKRKDGQPVNSQVAETLERIEQTEAETTVSTTNVVDDALSKVLGPDRGHVRGFGFGVTRSKLSLLSHQDHKYKVLEKEYLKMKEEMVEMKTMKDEMIEMKALMLSYLKKQTEPSEELSNATASVLKRLNIPPMPSPSSINNNSQTKCKLLDWYGSGEIVAEGRWSSNDPTAMVHHIPIGPHAIRVWIDVAKKPNAYLWRPTSEMTCIEEALGSTVAWPSDKVNEMESSSPED
ncbi:uncharacterized protein E5676_scaffold306G001840 [Cucumis melo var. makuwa]|uniref:Transposase n=2 Tax=Cucumis melo var. makuwa TaxID=1194695 RepID=A0A5D3D211_CUCMM|nr:uncharacterized protein E5676_scaffold306G001840 [Cucumis melo var. makuwa]